MKKKSLLVNSLSLAVAMSSFSAMAEEVTLRLSHWVPPSIAPAAKGIQPWAESVMAASNGRIKIDIFPAQQLGKAPDHYDMAQQGIVDLAYVNPGYTAGRFPIYALTELPFMMDDSVKGAQAIHEWYAKYGAQQEMGDVKVCFVHPHGPGAMHSKEDIRVPSDVAGKNVRPAHATMARFVSRLGGGPVQVPAPEVREAMSKGTAEAVTFPWGAIYDFKLTPEVPVHLDMPFYLSAQVMVMNKGSYDRLSDENKAVIDEHCSIEWSGKASQGWADTDAESRLKLMEDSTQRFNTPTEAEVAEWKAAAEPLLDEWKSAVAAKGGDAEAIYKDFVETLEKYDARY